MLILRKTSHVLVICCVLLCAGFGGYAQDIHLSQFYETPLLRNPALAGIFTGDVRVQAVYRNQWSSVTIPYQTGALSGEVKFHIGQHNDYITGGLQLTYDVAGASHFQTSQILPTINYHKSLSDERDMYLSVGVMGGITQKQFNPAKLTFDNQYNNGSFDPSAPSGENYSKIGFTYPDVATGISFSTAITQYINGFIGAAYYHFNRPKISFYNDESVELNPKWEFNAGLSTQLSDFTKFIFQYNQLKQGAYSEIEAGGLIGHAIQIQKGADMNTRMIYGGVFYRVNDAIIPVIKLELQKYEVGFSYDFNVSKLSTASQSFGGYEISISYKGFLNRAGSTLNALRCPRF